MIQDIAPLRMDNSFHQGTPRATDRALVFREQEVLVISRDEQLNLPCFGDIIPYWPYIEEDASYLFSIGEEQFFLLDEQRVNIALPGEFSLTSIDIFREIQQKYLAFAGITAHQLYAWYKNTKFCGCCGMQMRNSNNERARVCPNCGYTIYPPISPAVIVAITDGKRLLMARNAHGTYHHYALIAGFVEFGETLEDTVRREAMEEVGLHVKNVRYYKSQPWAFTGTEMIGFFAELDGDDTFTLADGELAEACWFAYDQIPPNAPRYKDFSIAQEMIDLVRQNKHI